MKTPDNLRFIHQKTPTPELDEQAKLLARSLSDVYYPTLTRERHGIVLLYQTRHAYLELVLTSNGVVEYEGADTSGSRHIRGRSLVGQSFDFLGAWLDNTG